MSPEIRPCFTPTPLRDVMNNLDVATCRFNFAPSWHCLASVGSEGRSSREPTKTARPGPRGQQADGRCGPEGTARDESFFTGRAWRTGGRAAGWASGRGSGSGKGGGGAQGAARRGMIHARPEEIRRRTSFCSRRLADVESHQVIRVINAKPILALTPSSKLLWSSCVEPFALTFRSPRGSAGAATLCRGKGKRLPAISSWLLL